MDESFIKNAEIELKNEIVNELKFLLSGLYWVDDINHTYREKNTIKKVIRKNDEDEIINRSIEISKYPDLSSGKSRQIIRKINEQIKKYEKLINNEVGFDYQILRKSAFELGRNSINDALPGKIESDSKNILYFKLAFYIGRTFAEILEKNKEQANIIYRYIDKDDYSLYLMGRKIVGMYLANEIKPSKNNNKIFEIVNWLQEDFEI